MKIFALLLLLVVAIAASVVPSAYGLESDEKGTKAMLELTCVNSKIRRMGMKMLQEAVTLTPTLTTATTRSTPVAGCASLDRGTGRVAAGGASLGLGTGRAAALVAAASQGRGIGLVAATSKLSDDESGDAASGSGTSVDLGEVGGGVGTVCTVQLSKTAALNGSTTGFSIEKQAGSLHGLCNAAAAFSPVMAPPSLPLNKHATAANLGSSRGARRRDPAVVHPADRPIAR
ncbi:hypothetical protein ON010_g3936 [Phytophthora cinnamomi]|nr:hypothetical protein ON010_g3936 [Phytophthora cinnamomi]